jgi:hypothetical protein
MTLNKNLLFLFNFNLNLTSRKLVVKLENTKFQKYPSYRTAFSHKVRRADERDKARSPYSHWESA